MSFGILHKTEIWRKLALCYKDMGSFIAQIKT